MFVASSLHKIYMLQSQPSGMVLGDGASGKCFCHKDGALINGICAFIKEAPEESLVPSIMWGYNEKSVTWKRDLTWLSWHSHLRLPTSRTVRKYVSIASAPQPVVLCYPNPGKLIQISLQEFIQWAPRRHTHTFCHHKGEINRNALRRLIGQKGLLTQGMVIWWP